MSFLSSLFGGSQSAPAPAAPTFYNDPLVGQSDSSMYNFGTNVLNGILPSSYQDLITPNSQQFQTMLANSNANISTAGLNTAAMQGNARGGAANAAITQSVASNTANLSYSDLLNTQMNQKALLGTGLDAINYAGNMALTNQGQVNSFNSGIYNDQLGYDVNMASINQKAAAAAGGLLSPALSNLGSGIGSLLGNIGMPTAAAGAGAAGAATLGSAATLPAVADSAGALASTTDLMSMFAPLALA